MRKVAIGFSFFCFLALAFSLSPYVEYLPFVQSLKKHFYEKDVEFTGLNLANKSSLIKVLPLNISTLNWLWRSDKVEKILVEHPLIEAAHIEQCKNNRWNCFHIDLVEETPVAIVSLKDSFWAIAEDGTFLTPIKSEHPSSLLSLPLISGVDIEFSSPEFVRGRTSYAMHIMRTIEEHSNMSIERLVIDNNGDLKVKFKGLDLTAIFQFADKNDDLIIDEVQRLKLVLANFKGKESLIEELDLAYNSQCIVRLTELGRELMKNSNKTGKTNRRI